MIRSPSNSADISSPATTMSPISNGVAFPPRTPRSLLCGRSQPLLSRRLGMSSTEPDSSALLLPSPPRRARSSLLPSGNDIDDLIEGQRLLTDSTNIPLIPSLDSPRETRLTLKKRNARRSPTSLTGIDTNAHDEDEPNDGDDSFDLELAALSLPHAVNLDGSQFSPFLPVNPGMIGRTPVDSTPSPSLVQFGATPPFAAADNLLSTKNTTSANVPENLLAPPPSLLDRSESDTAARLRPRANHIRNSYSSPRSDEDSSESKENKKLRIHYTV